MQANSSDPPDNSGLPTFVGIGVPRAGTTWLHELLTSHPRVWMPTKRKEVNFFNHQDKYERGVEWYRQFFPAAEEANRYEAIGEISTHYFYHERAARRLAAFQSVKKLLLTLRDPVERAASQWRFWRRTGDYRKSFTEFAQEERGWAVTCGRYAEHLERYLKYWRRDDLVVFVFERMVADPEATKDELAGALDLERALFPAEAGQKRKNESFQPRFPKLNATVNRTGQWLRERDLYWPINAAKSLGVKKVLRLGAKPAEFLEADHATRRRLWSELEEDVDQLSDMLEKDLSHWGPGAQAEDDEERAVGNGKTEPTSE